MKALQCGTGCGRAKYSGRLEGPEAPSLTGERQPSRPSSSPCSASPAPFVLAPRCAHSFPTVSTCQQCLPFGSCSCSPLHVEYTALLTFLKNKSNAFPHPPLLPTAVTHRLPARHPPQCTDMFSSPMGSSRVTALSSSSYGNSTSLLNQIEVCIFKASQKSGY